VCLAGRPRRASPSGRRSWAPLSRPCRGPSPRPV
jgi:hypothetical protein